MSQNKSSPNRTGELLSLTSHTSHETPLTSSPDEIILGPTMAEGIKDVFMGLTGVDSDRFDTESHAWATSASFGKPFDRYSQDAIEAYAREATGLAEIAPGGAIGDLYGYDIDDIVYSAVNKLENGIALTEAEKIVLDTMLEKRDVGDNPAAKRGLETPSWDRFENASKEQIQKEDPKIKKQWAELITDSRKPSDKPPHTDEHEETTKSPTKPKKTSEPPKGEASKKESIIPIPETTTEQTTTPPPKKTPTADTETKLEEPVNDSENRRRKAFWKGLGAFATATLFGTLMASIGNDAGSSALPREHRPAPHELTIDNPTYVGDFAEPLVTTAQKPVAKKPVKKAPKKSTSTTTESTTAKEVTLTEAEPATNLPTQETAPQVTEATQPVQADQVAQETIPPLPTVAVVEQSVDTQPAPTTALAPAPTKAVARTTPSTTAQPEAVIAETGYSLEGRLAGVHQEVLQQEEGLKSLKFEIPNGVGGVLSVVNPSMRQLEHVTGSHDLMPVSAVGPEYSAAFTGDLYKLPGSNPDEFGASASESYGPASDARGYYNGKADNSSWNVLWLDGSGAHMGQEGEVSDISEASFAVGFEGAPLVINGQPNTAKFDKWGGSDRRGHNFAAIMPDGQLMFGAVTGANRAELAQLLSQMGVFSAGKLDGGGSTGAKIGENTFDLGGENREVKVIGIR